MAVEAALAVVERGDDTLALAPISDVAGARARLAQLQGFVGSVMVEGHDFGKIPGTDKPTLYKPGAEKLLEIYGLAATYEVTHRLEEWERGFWHYETRCTIRSRRTGDVVGEGVGSCNSMEARYRWRTEWNNNGPATRPAGDGWELVSTRRGQSWKRRVENQDRWDLPNTILKMSKKRSLVDGTLSVTRSSGMFTQDVEDMPDFRPEEPSAPPVARAATVAPAPRPQPAAAPPAPAAVPDRPLTPEEATRLSRQIVQFATDQGYAEADALDWIERRVLGAGKDGLAELTREEGKALHAAAKVADFGPEPPASVDGDDGGAF